MSPERARAGREGACASARGGRRRARERRSQGIRAIECRRFCSGSVPGNDLCEFKSKHVGRKTHPNAPRDSRLEIKATCCAERPPFGNTNELDTVLGVRQF